MVFGRFATRRARGVVGPLEFSTAHRTSWGPVVGLCVAAALGGALIASMPAFRLSAGRIHAARVVEDVTETGAVIPSTAYPAEGLGAQLDPSPLGPLQEFVRPEAPTIEGTELASSEPATQPTGDISVPPVPEIAVIFITPDLPPAPDATDPAYVVPPRRAETPVGQPEADPELVAEADPSRAARASSDTSGSDALAGTSEPLQKGTPVRFRLPGALAPQR